MEFGFLLSMTAEPHEPNMHVPSDLALKVRECLMWLPSGLGMLSEIAFTRLSGQPYLASAPLQKDEGRQIYSSSQ